MGRRKKHKKKLLDFIPGVVLVMMMLLSQLLSLCLILVRQKAENDERWYLLGTTLRILDSAASMLRSHNEQSEDKLDYNIRSLLLP